ncbi:MAG: MFS transporter [Georgfuchsia sp.]
MKQKKGAFFGWQVLAALWVVYFVNMGLPFYGGGIINAQMLKELDMGRGMLGLGVTVLLLINGLFSPVTALVVNRIGARRTLFIGCMFHALGAFILSQWVTQGWQFVVAYGVIIGVALTSTYLPVQTCAAQWFVRRRAFALSIVLASVGIGGFVVSPLMAKIIAAAQGNWRVGWYFVTGVAMLAGLVSLLFVKNGPAEYGQNPDGPVGGTREDIATEGGDKKKTVYRTPDTWTGKEAARTRAMWLMILASVGFSIPFVTLISHAVPHLKDLGHTPVVAAMSLGALAFSSIFGKLGAGLLCDRIEPRYVWLVGMLLTGMSVVIAVGATTRVEVYLLGVFLGLGYGGSQVCWSAMTANYFGAGGFASAMGIQLPVSAVFSATAPLLVGLVYDAQGTYIYAFYAIAAFCFATGILLFAATPPKLPKIVDVGKMSTNLVS